MLRNEIIYNSPGDAFKNEQPEVVKKHKQEALENLDNKLNETVEDDLSNVFEVFTQVKNQHNSLLRLHMDIIRRQRTDSTRYGDTQSYKDAMVKIAIVAMKKITDNASLPYLAYENGRQILAEIERLGETKKLAEYHSLKTVTGFVTGYKFPAKIKIKEEIDAINDLNELEDCYNNVTTPNNILRYRREYTFLNSDLDTNTYKEVVLKIGQMAGELLGQNQSEQTSQFIQDLIKEMERLKPSIFSSNNKEWGLAIEQLKNPQVVELNPSVVIQQQ